MNFFEHRLILPFKFGWLIFTIGFILNIPLDCFGETSQYSANVRSFFEKRLKGGIESSDKQGVLIQKSWSEINVLLSQLDKQLSECQKDKESADNRCLEFNNKGWTDFSNLMGNVNDMAGMAMSASCSKLADLLKMGQGAQAGFRAQCAMAKDSCETSCKAATTTQSQIDKKLSSLGANSLVSNSDDGVMYDDIDEKKLLVRTEFDATLQCSGSVEQINESIKNLEEKLKEIPNDFKEINSLQDCQRGKAKNKDAIASISYWKDKRINDRGSLSDQIKSLQEETSKKGDENSAASMLKVCSDKAQILAKTSQNIAILMNSMQQNQACASEMQTFDSGIDLKNCALTGTCTPTDAANDCADPKYKESIYCKSYTAGTGNRAVTGNGTSSSLTDPNALLNDKGTFGDLSMGAGGVDGASMDGNSAFDKIGDTASPKSAGIPGGGGSGGLSIPGGGYNPNGRGGGRGVAGDSTTYGGNPSYAGGGNFGSSSGNSGDKNKDSLDKYLPGAEKDPLLTKKGIGPEGITSPGGLTLFEKVTKSYQSNRSLLMPD